jgi:hypothetical protein
MIKHTRIIGNWLPELEFYQPNFGRQYLTETKNDPSYAKDWEKLNVHTITAHEGLKVPRNTRGFVDPILMPTIEKLRNLCGLENLQMIICKYDQGTSNLIHVDYLPKYDHVERPGVLLDQDKLDNNSRGEFVRMLMLLKDREPGQYMQMGETMLNDWKAGDLFFYQGQQIYHSAGSCGSYPRFVLRFTGLPTKKFDNFINTSEHYI